MVGMTHHPAEAGIKATGGDDVPLPELVETGNMLVKGGLLPHRRGSVAAALQPRDMNSCPYTAQPRQSTECQSHDVEEHLDDDGRRARVGP